MPTEGNALGMPPKPAGNMMQGRLRRMAGRRDAERRRAASEPRSGRTESAVRQRASKLRLDRLEGDVDASVG